jgi:uncharacterized membrane protein YdjX (TVP38/TMEM64 family)
MKKSKKIIFIIITIVATAILCFLIIPPVLSLRDPVNQVKFEEFIESIGVWGILVMLAIQVLQIIVAIIPGEPIELLMGLMYGTFGGLSLSLLGIVIGTSIVFYMVKRFGKKFAGKFVDISKFNKLAFLRIPSKRDMFIFLLFFIPGTPKDVLTYFAPFTGIAFGKFLLLSTIARIPSVISSTLVGATVSEGKLINSIIIYAITGLIGLAGIIINNRFTSRRRKIYENQKIARR